MAASGIPGSRHSCCRTKGLGGLVLPCCQTLVAEAASRYLPCSLTSAAGPEDPPPLMALVCQPTLSRDPLRGCEAAQVVLPSMPGGKKCPKLPGRRILGLLLCLDRPSGAS